MEKYWLTLCQSGLYPYELKKMLDYFDSPKEIWYAPEYAFDRWEDQSWVKHFWEYRRKTDPQTEENRFKKKEMKFVSRDHISFPKKLKNLPDCPAGLFYYGHLPDPEKFCVAVVGARNCSGYGRSIAGAISLALAKAGIVVISGMAMGIDGIAQSKALEAGGESFGVLGCGADICYPRENLELYLQLKTRGGILSEFAPGTKPLSHHFPQRNRIISGLADAVIVIEAKRKSGSLITADFALEQGKDVFAVPGRVGDSLSEGCNDLIGQGAGVITSVENLLDSLRVSIPKKDRAKVIGEDERKLTADEKWIYDNLSYEPKSLEELLFGTDLDFVKLNEILLSLELRGWICEVGRGRFCRTR